MVVGTIAIVFHRPFARLGGAPVLPRLVGAGGEEFAPNVRVGSAPKILLVRQTPVDAADHVAELRASVCRALPRAVFRFSFSPQPL